MGANRQLRLDGIDVCASYLTQRSFRAAYCDLLLNVTRKNKEAALARFQRVGEFGAYSGLRVSGIADLGFLRKFPKLLYLEIVDQKKVDTRQLDDLTNLRGLRLESPGAGIDFARFPELEVFIGDWHADNRGLDQCPELRRMRVWQFRPPSCDLTVLRGLVRLEQLEITQTNITSLAGLESLEDLRYLEIAYAPNLTSMDALRTGASSLREFALSKLKHITDYRPIAAIDRLRRLKLSSCGPMPNLRWTAGMDHLDFFSFVETNVEDGDLTPLLELPLLRYVGTSDKRHYSHKSNAINQLLVDRYSARGNTAEV